MGRVRASAATALAGVLGGVLLLLLGATPAHAEGYRYWSFWTRADDGSDWAYATQGPATLRPADGAVVGLRFAVTENSEDAARPRQRDGFETVCADTPPREGRKRVALVIDPGTPADAPEGETPPEPWEVCAAVAPDASVGDALAATAPPLRYDASALLCAVAGYPATECGPEVDASAPRAGTDGADGAGDEPSGPAGEDGVPFGLVYGGAAVVLLGGAAAWQARRRRRS
ncbi:SCO2322 family protein [Streptomyces chumphonensis]|uniref:SCO2322 family protein n=1 Tax=Streptomyces chumphonensis TaxID=1214925 RepID=UPI003D70F429